MKLKELYSDAFYYLDVDIPARDWKYFKESDRLFKAVELNPTYETYLDFSEKRQDLLWSTIDSFFKAHNLAPELYMGFAEMIFPSEALRYKNLYKTIKNKKN